MDYGTTQPKAGMGTVKIKTREEYLLHPTVAFTPERVNLGVVGMKVWQRPEQPVAQQRKSKPKRPIRNAHKISLAPKFSLCY